MKATVRFTVEVDHDDNIYVLYSAITDYLANLPEDTKVEINPTSNVLNYPPGTRSGMFEEVIHEHPWTKSEASKAKHGRGLC